MQGVLIVHTAAFVNISGTWKGKENFEEHKLKGYTDNWKMRSGGGFNMCLLLCPGKRNQLIRFAAAWDFHFLVGQYMSYTLDRYILASYTMTFQQRTGGWVEVYYSGNNFVLFEFYIKPLVRYIQTTSTFHRVFLFALGMSANYSRRGPRLPNSSQ